MNNENYEQITLNEELLNGNKNFLEDGVQLFLDIIAEEIVGMRLPKTITVEVREADAVVKGQTASSSFIIQRLAPPIIEAKQDVVRRSI